MEILEHHVTLEEVENTPKSELKHLKARVARWADLTGLSYCTKQELLGAIAQHRRMRKSCTYTAKIAEKHRINRKNDANKIHALKRTVETLSRTVLQQNVAEKVQLNHRAPEDVINIREESNGDASAVVECNGIALPVLVGRRSEIEQVCTDINFDPNALGAVLSRVPSHGGPPMLVATDSLPLLSRHPFASVPHIACAYHLESFRCPHT